MNCLLLKVHPPIKDKWGCEGNKQIPMRCMSLMDHLAYSNGPRPDITFY